MIGICKAEHSLFYQVFGGSSPAATEANAHAHTTASSAATQSASSGTASSAGSAPTTQPTQWLDSAQQALGGMLEALCSLLSDLLRPMVLVIHDVDTLCELVHILSTEILSETIKRAGAAVPHVLASTSVCVHANSDCVLYVQASPWHHWESSSHGWCRTRRNASSTVRST
jgi:hypothetical protein